MSISDPTIVTTVGDGVLATSTRPWMPFAIGFGLGLGASLYGVYDGSWKMRHSIQNPWDYDSEYAKAWASFKRTNWNWSILGGAPFIVGFVLWL
ncbi:hypothetical protein, partial [Halorubrum sp. SP9]